MRITVSGKPLEAAEGLTLGALMEQQKVESPQYVTVAVNGQFVPSDGKESCPLHDGDTVEFLYFMGGGCHGADA